TTSTRPSGLTAGSVPPFERCAVDGETGLPLAASQTRASWARVCGFHASVITKRPFGVKATDCTVPSGGRKSVIGLPFERSQTRALWSLAAVAISRPSGLKAAQRTGPWCDNGGEVNRRSAKSQTRTLLASTA